jgi:DNA-binding response OmpR family regulator
MYGPVILLVEDDLVVMQALSNRLTAEGFQVVGAPKGACAAEAVRGRVPDLMILDLGLIDDNPGNSLNDGFAVLSYLRWTFPEAAFPVIIHTADLSAKVDQLAAKNGVFAVFRKGDDLGELVAAVGRALEARCRSQVA